MVFPSSAMVTPKYCGSGVVWSLAIKARITGQTSSSLVPRPISKQESLVSQIMKVHQFQTRVAP